MSGVHIFYGHAKRRDPSRPRCDWCNKRPREIAFTYVAGWMVPLALNFNHRRGGRS